VFYCGNTADSDGPRNPRVTLLTDAERDCLRLVFQHMTSKDIARQLGVSPHTVDMRLRQAIRKLEVTNRIEAARALVHTEILLGIAQPVADNATGDAYQELIYQASEIADDAKSATIGAPAS
jgi:DNA-binding CsgD family transcriptional regulator